MKTIELILAKIPVPSLAKDCGVWSLITRPTRGLNRKTGVHTDSVALGV